MLFVAGMHMTTWSPRVVAVLIPLGALMLWGGCGKVGERSQSGLGGPSELGAAGDAANGANGAGNAGGAGGGDATGGGGVGGATATSGSGHSGGSAAGGSTAGADAPPEWARCDSDDQCRLDQRTCCGCEQTTITNAFAYNAAHVKEASAEVVTLQCTIDHLAMEDCPYCDGMSPDPSLYVVCEQGVCAVKQHP